MSAHMTPEQVRSKIDHPIIDGDGHWVEYDPVFSEKMRKVGGDLAADGFLKAMATTRESLSMTVDERRHKRIGQSAFWARQAENTLDRATAMMPKLLYDRLDELGLDFVIVYPTAGLRFPPALSAIDRSLPNRKADGARCRRDAGGMPSGVILWSR